jgi:NAD(P)-dependent dehydrogenase (short-subunit alcohol dehydrogenase family)
VVSEKTGYPVESLDLSLSLDADLGVDSIKRVEILSALQERLPGAPQVRPEHLGTLHSLKDVAAFLAAPAPGTAEMPILPVNDPKRGELIPPETERVSKIRPPQIPDAPPQAMKPPSDVVRTAGARAVPEANARPALVGGGDRVDRSTLQAVDLDLGTPRPRVPLASGGEFWVVGEPDALTAAVCDHLKGQGFNPKPLGWSAPTPKFSGPLAGLVLLAPRSPEAEPGLNRRAFEWLKLAGPRLRQPGRASVFVTVARLDGAFGLANLPPAASPAGGGLAGLVKTVRHEWPEVYCKAVDLSPASGVTQAAAAAVVDEILSAGPVEVGIAATHRCTLELARSVRRPGPQPINLGSKDVILVTGGARGVTAEVAVALAETYSPTLVLTGRTPPPAPEPDWLAGLSTEAELKKAIAAKLGPDAGPRQVGEQYQKVVTRREVRRTLERITAAGARAAYLPVDINDGQAVAELVRQVRAKFGPVTALVHGAGVLADKKLEDLTPEQFDLVYNTKVEGLRNVLGQLADAELKALVLFSSTTARFGRTGQAAYACANEVLNKTAQVESRRRPGCRVVAINWGPWDGGMVTPGLRRVFESEGVGLIGLADGAVFLVQELSAAGKAVEVIALARRPGSTTSGVIPVATRVPPEAAGATPAPPLASVTGTGPPAPEMSQAFERAVDANTHPVLKAHVIDGRAVLPMAVHLEWLAHAALHGNPGLVFHGFNDLRVTSGVQIDGSAPVQIRALAGRAVKQDKLFVVPVELRVKRKDGREAVSSRAEIVLVSALPPAPPADRPPKVEPLPYAVSHAYRELLFHGPQLHGIDRIDGSSEAAFIGTATAAPPPGEWFQSPLRSSWVADPLVLDASFQMMILWTQARHDRGSLPCFAGRYRQFRKSFPADPTTVVIRVRRDDGRFARSDIDYLDPDGRVIAQMQDYECVMEETLNQAFRKNRLVRQ